MSREAPQFVLLWSCLALVLEWSFRPGVQAIQQFPGIIGVTYGDMISIIVVGSVFLTAGVGLFIRGTCRCAQAPREALEELNPAFFRRVVNRVARDFRR